MRTPAVYTATEIRSWLIDEEFEPNKWRPARPCPYTIEFKVRLRIAWRVFIGILDALNWGEKSGEWSNAQCSYVEVEDHGKLMAIKKMAEVCKEINDSGETYNHPNADGAQALANLFNIL